MDQSRELLLLCTAVLAGLGCSSSESPATTLPADAGVAAPLVYVTFYSHNEEDGYWQTLINDQQAYLAYRTDLVAKVNLIREYGATLNWETDHTVLEALQAQEKEALFGDTQGKNLLRWMKEDRGVVVDPHLHPSEFNYADIAHFIEQFGISASGVVGGVAVVECGQTKGTFKYTDWRATLKIGEDGLVRGSRWPEATWQPKVLAQPAMTGHALDDFSSGVWNPGISDQFYDHQADSAITYVGQGYPHDVLNIGSENSGGTEILYDHGGYIRELVSKIESGALPRKSLYTASIHLRDQPSQPGVMSILEGLRQTLQALEDLKSSGKIAYLDYEGVVKVWREQFNSEPSQVKIDGFSIYSKLMDTVDEYCWSGVACGAMTCPSGQVCESAQQLCVPDCRKLGCPAQLPTCDTATGVCKQ